MIRSEELAKTWVRRVSANVARIEVIGCVKDAHRDSHSILLCHLKLFCYFRVEGQESRKTRLVRIAHADEILLSVAH